MKLEVKEEVEITLSYKLEKLDTSLRKISSHLNIQTTPDTLEDNGNLIDRLIATVDTIEQRAVAIHREILKLSVADISKEDYAHISREDYANNDE